MNYQRGISLNGMIIGCVVLALAALLTMKVLPEWLEYAKVVKAVKATATDSALKDASVVQVRNAYAKRADIDEIKSMPAGDLQITKDGGELVISFEYQRKVHLFHNVSLVFDFEGSSSKQ